MFQFKTQTWYQFENLQFTYFPINEHNILVLEDLSSNKTYFCLDHALSFPFKKHKAREFNENTGRLRSLEPILKKNTISFYEVDPHLSFIEENILKSMFTASEIKDRIHFMFLMYQGYKMMDREYKVHRPETFLKLGSKNILIRNYDEKLFFKFADVCKALGYKSSQNDSFNDLYELKSFNGRELAFITLENIMKMKHKMHDLKIKDKHAKLVNKIFNYVYKKNFKNMIFDHENSFFIFDKNIFDFKKDFGTVLVKNAHLLDYLGYNDDRTRGGLKTLSVYDEEENSYYIEINNLKTWMNSISTPEYKERLKTFIKATAKFV